MVDRNWDKKPDWPDARLMAVAMCKTVTCDKSIADHVNRCHNAGWTARDIARLRADLPKFSMIQHQPEPAVEYYDRRREARKKGDKFIEALRKYHPERVTI